MHKKKSFVRSVFERMKFTVQAVNHIMISFHMTRSVSTSLLGASYRGFDNPLGWIPRVSGLSSQSIRACMDRLRGPELRTFCARCKAG